MTLTSAQLSLLKTAAGRCGVRWNQYISVRSYEAGRHISKTAGEQITDAAILAIQGHRIANFSRFVPGGVTIGVVLERFRELHLQVWPTRPFPVIKPDHSGVAKWRTNFGDRDHGASAQDR